MSNESSAPMTLEEITLLTRRVDALDRQPPAWTRGDIKMWYGALADVPTGWWPCDGTAAPDGVTTPDLRGRVPVGLHSGVAAFDTLGETGGADQHAHSGGPHDHTISARSSAVYETGGGADHALDTTVNLTHAGSDKVARELHTHNTAGTTDGAVYTGNTGNASSYPPYAVVHFLYRYV